MLRHLRFLALLILLCCAQAQAAEAPAARPSGDALAAAGLLEPSRLDKTLVLDIRYATADNFTGRRVYPSACCYLRADAARRLAAVQADLRRQGLGLKIYDCYRPFSVQEIFWRIMPDERYVLEPRRENGRIVKSSRHNRGMAVDVGLVDLAGRELPMPTAYDDFTEKAHRDSTAASAIARRNSKTLERAMTARGFEPLPTEWWHFDAAGWQDFDPLDLGLPAD